MRAAFVSDGANSGTRPGCNRSNSSAHARCKTPGRLDSDHRLSRRMSRQHPVQSADAVPGDRKRDRLHQQARPIADPDSIHHLPRIQAAVAGSRATSKFDMNHLLDRTLKQSPQERLMTYQLDQFGDGLGERLELLVEGLDLGVEGLSAAGLGSVARP